MAALSASLSSSLGLREGCVGSSVALVEAEVVPVALLHTGPQLYPDVNEKLEEA